MVAKGAVGAMAQFTSDHSVGVFKYPDGRISIYRFHVWEDGVCRCDCPWKRHHWDEDCKHEVLRKESIQREKSA